MNFALTRCDKQRKANTSASRTMPTFASAHTFCASRRAWFKWHVRARVNIDAIDCATKYTTKMKTKFFLLWRNQNMRGSSFLGLIK